jgi:hypothetical protein
VNGTLEGAPFVVRDARYVVDRRVGYEHTDLRLSSGKADGPCGSIDPPNAASVWLRLQGPERIKGQDVRIAPGDAGAWSVHYQIFDVGQWRGVGDANALVSIQDPSADGRITGGLAACFAGDARSCVSGSFVATSCPARIDEPVRGALPPETVKEKR